jgi:hypothetical protein
MMALEWAESIMRQWDSLTKEELAGMRFDNSDAKKEIPNG